MDREYKFYMHCAFVNKKKTRKLTCWQMSSKRTMTESQERSWQWQKVRNDLGFVLRSRKGLSCVEVFLRPTCCFYNRKRISWFFLNILAWIFLFIFNFFYILILKIIFKNKKIYYFNIFLNKKYFKKQSTNYLFSCHPAL